MNKMFGQVFGVLFAWAVIVVGMGGCASVARDGWHQSSPPRAPSLGLRLVARYPDRMVFQWRIENRCRSSIWVAVAREYSAETTFMKEPRAYVLPHDTLLFAFAEPRVSEEQDSGPATFESESLPDFGYVKLAPGRQVTGRFSVALPFDPPPPGALKSVFQFKGDYEHLPGLFSAIVDETSASMKAAKQVLFAIEYRDVNPFLNVPDDQQTYDRLYWNSLVHQAILAKKYPAEELEFNVFVTRHILATAALPCLIPLKRPVEVYYATPVKVNEPF